MPQSTAHKGFVPRLTSSLEAGFAQRWHRMESADRAAPLDPLDGSNRHHRRMGTEKRAFARAASAPLAVEVVELELIGARLGQSLPTLLEDVAEKRKQENEMQEGLEPASKVSHLR